MRLPQIDHIQDLLGISQLHCRVDVFKNLTFDYNLNLNPTALHTLMECNEACQA